MDWGSYLLGDGEITELLRRCQASKWTHVVKSQGYAHSHLIHPFPGFDIEELAWKDQIGTYNIHPLVEQCLSERDHSKIRDIIVTLKSYPVLAVAYQVDYFGEIYRHLRRLPDSQETITLVETQIELLLNRLINEVKRFCVYHNTFVRMEDSTVGLVFVDDTEDDVLLDGIKSSLDVTALRDAETMVGIVDSWWLFVDTDVDVYTKSWDVFVADEVLFNRLVVYIQTGGEVVGEWKDVLFEEFGDSYDIIREIEGCLDACLERQKIHRENMFSEAYHTLGYILSQYPVEYACVTVFTFLKRVYQMKMMGPLSINEDIGLNMCGNLASVLMGYQRCLVVFYFLTMKRFKNPYLCIDTGNPKEISSSSSKKPPCVFALQDTESVCRAMEEDLKMLRGFGNKILEHHAKCFSQ